MTDEDRNRTEILRRIRDALADAPDDEPVRRDYFEVHAERTPEQSTDLLARHLAGYRAQVHRCAAADLPGTIAGVLSAHGSARVVTPAGLPRAWLAEVTDTEVVAGGAEWEARELDAVDSVVTGCALAIAETGTLVLDGGPEQGRRVLTLVPDHHVCVVRVPEQLVDSVPQALPRLSPVRPPAWISGPSATSDIEWERTEGVHGPRTLDVVLVTGAGPVPDSV